MSNTTTYINFSSIDYKNENSLSSYALELTPLTFVPDIDPTTTSRLVWDFGDGTNTTAFSASKSYKFPGIYNVNLIIYDCDTNAKISTFEKAITIKDYTPFTFNVDLGEDWELKLGKITGPIEFSAQFPPYQSPSNIFYTISGSQSQNYWNLSANKFNHLKRYNTLYDKKYNKLLSGYQYEEIPYVTLSSYNIYGKIDNNLIVSCLSSDSGAFEIGKIGSAYAYIKDDSKSDKIILESWFDKTNNDVTFYNKSKVSYLNNMSILLSSQVLDNVPVKFSITSNGLDGEGFVVDSFNISPIKFSNIEIPFVIKLKDVDDMSVKNFDKISLSSLNITLSATGDTVVTSESGEELLDEYGNWIYGSGLSYTVDDTDYTITDLNSSTLYSTDGGFFRGSLRFNNLSSILQNVTISVSGSVTSHTLSTYALTGESSRFNVYNKDYYDLYKKNENFSASDTVKDLIFQETMLDKPKLFDNFIGGVLGDSDISHDDIGTKLYEKISNFVNNTQNIDTCELDYLESISQYLNYEDVGEEKYTYPDNIKRLMNLASISKGNLIGELNKFDQNFDIKGRSSKDIYGRNIGSEIDTLTYTISSDVPIVSLEKFSNTYSKINTYQPSISLSSSTYPLSSYSSDWGWGLVLPNNFNIVEMSKYYKFFSYVTDVDNTVVGGIVDYDNNKTTIDRGLTSDELYNTSGILEHMILDTLYQSLSLIQ